MDILVSLQTLLKMGHLNRLSSLCVYFHSPLDQMFVSDMSLPLESVLRIGCRSRVTATITDLREQRGHVSGSLLRQFGETSSKATKKHPSTQLCCNVKTSDWLCNPC